MSSIFLNVNGWLASAGTEWNDLGCVDPNDLWQCIDNGCTNDGESMYTEDWPATSRFHVQNPSYAGICKSIRVCCWTWASGAQTWTIRIYDGGTQIGGAKTFSAHTSWPGATRTTSWWTGLSKTAAQLSDLRVQISAGNWTQINECMGVRLELSVTAT